MKLILPKCFIVLLYTELLLLCFGSMLNAQIISLVAGSDCGDRGIATSAKLGLPANITLDAAGNVYIADTYNNRIRKVSTSGIITTIAGNGIQGFSGDGGLATSAKLYNPNGVVIDAAGNIFIADTYNFRIRKINNSGIISTVTGTGVAGAGGDGGNGLYANLNYPFAIAMDAAGNMFIADYGNHAIRKVTSSGIITTIAGNGTKGFSGDGGIATNASMNNPAGVAVDAAGNIYFSDYRNNRIRKINSSGIISTVAGSGAGSFYGDGGGATSAQIYGPRGLAVDAAGNIFIAEEANEIIRKVNSSGIISTVAGNRVGTGVIGDGVPALNAILSTPTGVAVDATGNMYIADTYHSKIRKVNSSGIINTIAGGSVFAGDGIAATIALMEPTGVAVDATGNIYFSDYSNNRIRKVNNAGIINTAAGNGVTGFAGDGAAATSANLSSPYGVALDKLGNIYFVDQSNNRIRKVSTTGIITTVAGNGIAAFSGDGGAATAASLNMPNAVAVDATGNIYIADVGNYRIRKVSTSGIITTVAGNGTYVLNGDGGAATGAGLGASGSIALDAVGNLYLVAANSIRKVDINGIITTVAGSFTAGYGIDSIAATTSKLYCPCSVGVDAVGNLFIADGHNNRVRKVDANGLISTVAGNGIQGDGIAELEGDGGPATSATLYGPKELTIDAKGNIYLVDGNKIRKINNQTIITSFSPVAAGFGVTVTIKGYKFTGVTAVSFGGSSAVSFTVLNDSTITAKLGNGATGAVSITYSSGTGTATATLPGFTYISTLISIAGKVINPSAAGYKSITGATISITGGSNVQSIAGEYKIYNLNNGSYTIKATKNNDINKTNGVTTLDIALVQSLVLGKSLLNSPYKLIAADVNGDGKVSTLDIVYMKRLILGIDTTFTKAVTGEKRLWTFVDSSLQFTDVTNPFPIKDSIKFIALNTSKTNQTFIGCKLGDVNWDWNPAIAKPARPVATKVQGELKLETEDNTID